MNAVRFLLCLVLTLLDSVWPPLAKTQGKLLGPVGEVPAPCGASTQVKC